MSDKDENVTNVTNVQISVDGYGMLRMITDMLNDCKIAY